MTADDDVWLREAEAVLSRLLAGWRPTSAEMAGCPRIDDWSIVEVADGSSRLVGKVTGHPDPTVGRGPLTMTSALLCLADDAGWARTASRYYLLGRPGPSQRDQLTPTERARIVLRAAAWLERERYWSDGEDTAGGI